MLSQVTGIWKFRSFLLALVRLDFRLKYKRSALGTGWALVTPLAMAATYVLVFSGVLGLSAAEYATSLLVALAVWGFFRECAVSGCLALVSHENYIRQSPLPFGLYSLRFVIGYAIQGLFAFGVALVALVIKDGHAGKLLMLWAVVPALLMIFVAGWAVATIFAFAQVHFHDTKHLLEIFAQILFFMTPIVYGPELLVGKGLGWVARFNPLNTYLELVRCPLTRGELPQEKLYLYGAICTVALYGLAVATTARFQKKVVFQI
ncbi:MAG TPA: ABC transporter permease [Gemmata sp.]